MRRGARHAHASTLGRQARHPSASGVSCPVIMGWVDDFCKNPKWDDSHLSDLSLTGETPCFESIVLAGAVQVAFVVLVPWRIYQVSSRRALAVAA